MQKSADSKSTQQLHETRKTRQQLRLINASSVDKCPCIIVAAAVALIAICQTTYSMCTSVILTCLLPLAQQRRYCYTQFAVRVLCSA
jgi:hypothetical protein